MRCKARWKRWHDKRKTPNDSAERKKELAAKYRLEISCVSKRIAVLIILGKCN